MTAWASLKSLPDRRPSHWRAHSIKALFIGQSHERINGLSSNPKALEFLVRYEIRNQKIVFVNFKALDLALK